MESSRQNKDRWRAVASLIDSEGQRPETAACKDASLADVHTRDRATSAPHVSVARTSGRRFYAPQPTSRATETNTASCSDGSPSSRGRSVAATGSRTTPLTNPHYFDRLKPQSDTRVSTALSTPRGATGASRPRTSDLTARAQLPLACGEGRAPSLPIPLPSEADKGSLLSNPDQSPRCISYPRKRGASRHQYAIYNELRAEPPLAAKAADAAGESAHPVTQCNTPPSIYICCQQQRRTI